jgi:hypothetical protein
VILILAVFVLVAVASNVIMFVVISSDLFLYFKLVGPFLLLQIFCLVAGPIIGIVAAVMAQSDLRNIRAGAIHASAHSKTRWGKGLAVSGAILSPLTALVGLSLLFTSVRMAAVRDEMTTHLVDLGSHAHQYRHRPATLGGGGGSYSGYRVPDRMLADEYGTYTAVVVHRDTLLLEGQSTLVEGTVSLKVDSAGRSTGNAMFGGLLDF